MMKAVYKTHDIDTKLYHQAIISWGIENFQQFPWRDTKSPYHILIAEVMLHRTRAQQVIPVYAQFIADYPNLHDLEGVTIDQLYKLFFSLGLPQRVVFFHNMLQALFTRFNGEIPKSKTELISLPGISNYIASAVRCFAWNFPDVLIDTNTIRIIARIFDIEIKDSLRRNKGFMEIMESLLDIHSPRNYNFALIDLAHQICSIREPACDSCPILEFCVFGQGIATKAEST